MRFENIKYIATIILGKNIKIIDSVKWKTVSTLQKGIEFTFGRESNHSSQNPILLNLSIRCEIRTSGSICLSSLSMGLI